MTVKLTPEGQELPDPTPVALPIGLGVAESMDQRIARILRHSASVEAAKHGMETFEEADDFDIEDDPADPSTPYERDFDHATINAVERGIVSPPKPVSQERLQELQGKYSKNKPPKASHNQDPPEKPKEAPTGPSE